MLPVASACHPSVLSCAEAQLPHVGLQTAPYRSVLLQPLPVFADELTIAIPAGLAPIKGHPLTDDVAVCVHEARR